MTLEHVAIWTRQLEALKAYYETYFGGVAREKYTNPQTAFENYFLRFGSGARFELMSKPGVPSNQNDTVNEQYLGIIHLAFGVETMAEVDAKARQLQQNGFPILRGPRKPVTAITNLKRWIPTTTGWR